MFGAISVGAIKIANGTQASEVLFVPETVSDAEVVILIAPAGAEATLLQVSYDYRPARNGDVGTAGTWATLQTDGNDGTAVVDVAGPAAAKARSYRFFGGIGLRLFASAGNVAADRTFQVVKHVKEIC